MITLSSPSETVSSDKLLASPWARTVLFTLQHFFLFTYELDFIRTLIAENKFDVLKAFANTFRYIDDVLPLNNPFFETYLPSIYPHSLKVNLEQTGNTVHFLDLIIKCKNSKKFPFTTDLFDKRTLPKFANLPMTRYPHRSSFVPAHFGLNIVTSQGFRLLRRCLRKKIVFSTLPRSSQNFIPKGFQRNFCLKLRASLSVATCTYFSKLRRSGTLKDSLRVESTLCFYLNAYHSLRMCFPSFLSNLALLRRHETREYSWYRFQGGVQTFQLF